MKPEQMKQRRAKLWFPKSVLRQVYCDANFKEIQIDDSAEAGAPAIDAAAAIIPEFTWSKESYLMAITAFATD